MKPAEGKTLYDRAMVLETTFLESSATYFEHTAMLDCARRIRRHDAIAKAAILLSSRL